MTAVQAQAVVGEPTPSTGRTGPRRAVLLPAAAGLLAVLVLALVVGDSLPARVLPGAAQAGPLLDWALPVVTLAARLAAVGTIGTLLFAAVLVPVTGPSLPDAGRRSLRAAARWAAAWAVATLLTGPLTVARLTGAFPSADSARAFAGLPAGRAVLLVTLLAAIVAVLAWGSRTAFDAIAVLAVAGAGVVWPVITTGHSAAEGDHLLAISVLGTHVLGASLWVGGLAGLVLHGRDPAVLGAAASRFSALALGCFVVVGGTGLTAAWIVLGSSPSGLAGVLGTGYGTLLLVKTAALLALGGFGAVHRRRTLPRLRAGRPGAFRRFAAVEIAVLLGTVAVAVALAASPPPAAAAVAVAATPAAPSTTGVAPDTTDPMAGHDHGELSVGVLVDDVRFHVPRPVEAGSVVTVFNSSDAAATITADDGSFDVDVPGHALVTFPAPDGPGSYGFVSRTDPAYRDVLVVE